MRNALNHSVADAFHEAAQPHVSSRLFAYVQAIAACGLLVLAGMSLLAL